MSGKQLTFATLNLNNLQLPNRAMYRGETYTQAEADAKISWTAQMLREADADIFGFQELWSPGALEQAFQEAGLQDDYKLVTVKNEDPSEISVALAVRNNHQVVYRRWHKDFPPELVLRKRRGQDADGPDYTMSVDVATFSRGMLRVTVRPEAPSSAELPDIVVFVAHLKSKLAMRLDKPEKERSEVSAHSSALGSALSTIRRTAEAAALRILLNKVMRDTQTPVVVLGDLNDTQLGVITSVLTGAPKYRLFAKSRVGGRSDKGLYSVASLQEYRSLRDVYYTYLHDGQRVSLDHILVSEQFYDYSSRHIWTFREMRLVNDHLGRELPHASDHAMVTAVFDLNPAD
ncbi:MAG: endonuclease/exonuclease/phosphatase family protein [Planctomycetota bacterium]|jgi:endonuclease/exonuclease/phosphatase family metal-dependent hydrolase